MRILADQDIYQMTIEWLKENGHNVVTAKDLGMQRSSDEELLIKAKAMNRLFLTRDKDFGALVFLKTKPSTGVILLRLSPTSLEEVHKELKRVFEEHKEEELKEFFCVVEPDKHRLRQLPKENG